MHNKYKNLIIILLLTILSIILFAIYIALSIFVAFSHFSADKKNDAKVFVPLVNGFINDVKGKDKQAYKDFTYVIKISPNNAMAYQGRGDLELEHGFYADAIRDYDNALLIYPDYTYVYKKRAQAKRRIRDIAGANADFAIYKKRKSMSKNQKTEEFYNSKPQKSLPKPKFTSGDVDFGPYMRNLQISIKSKWNPPPNFSSNRVVLLFKIRKDGTVLSTRIFKSSGNKDVDNAALKAFQDAQPLQPLPAEFKDKSVDVQFTFDYNLLGKNKSN